MNPVEFYEQFKHKAVRVILEDGRKYQAILQGLDQHMNVVLEKPGDRMIVFRGTFVRKVEVPVDLTKKEIYQDQMKQLKKIKEEFGELEKKEEQKED